MKKVILVLVALAMANPLCFAAEKTKKTVKKTAAAPAVAAAPVQAPIVRPTVAGEKATAVGKEVAGTVSSISLGDAVSGAAPKIEVAAKTGEKMTIGVAPGTKIFSVDRKVVTLDKLTNGTRVFVTYSELVGTGEKTAKTINSVK
jgi:hypothetical protein